MDQDTFYRLTTQSGASRLTDARREAVGHAGRRAHDLEPVAVLEEVEYINDSKSTFLDATLQSISSFNGRVVWIAGIAGAEQAQGPVLEFLKEQVGAIILYGKTGQRNGELMELFDDHAYVTDDVRTAVFLARELTGAGDVVLFSPACPSRPMPDGEGFANYEERGMEFKRAVRDL